MFTKESIIVIVPRPWSAPSVRTAPARSFGPISDRDRWDPSRSTTRNEYVYTCAHIVYNLVDPPLTEKAYTTLYTRFRKPSPGHPGRSTTGEVDHRGGGRPRGGHPGSLWLPSGEVDRSPGPILRANDQAQRYGHAGRVTRAVIGIPTSRGGGHLVARGLVARKASRWSPGRWSPGRWRPSRWSPGRWSPGRWKASRWSPGRPGRSPVWDPSRWRASR